MTRVFLLLLTLMAAPLAVAKADVRLGDPTHAVSVPYTPWEMQFAAEGRALGIKRERPDGLQFYYLFDASSSGVIASFYLEPAAKCGTSQACRDLFWSDPGPIFQNRENVRFLDVNGFSVVEFTTSTAGVNQGHWSAHLVHDGVWVDVHLSRQISYAVDFTDFAKVIIGLSIAKKPSCPTCLPLAGISRQVSTILFSQARQGDAQASARLIELANEGDAEAQFMAARIYSWGTPHVTKDDAQSVAWVRKAATQGHAEAQVNLGYLLVSGQGVDKPDPSTAHAWWMKAADQGFAPAQFNLSNVYSTDRTLKDDAKYIALLTKAAEAGLAQAQLNLGAAYGLGKGAPQDSRLALAWYGKAAAQGNETAMINIAVIRAFSTDQYKSLDEAIRVISSPVLAGNERAKLLKAQLCRDNPDACQQSRR